VHRRSCSRPLPIHHSHSSQPKMVDLFLDGTTAKAKVLPVCYFGILDHYSRRSEVQQEGRVIGTLLGVQNPDGTVEITNCFPVPHNETDEQVAVDMEYHRTMFDLHRQVNSKETIVGWYATGSEITEHSVLIHEFYSRETENPIHLCVDTDLKNERMAITAYVSASMGVPDMTVGTVFTPILCETRFHETDDVGLQVLKRTLASPDNTSSLVTDLEHVSNSIMSLQDKITIALEYVDKVLTGKVPGDKKIGRYLLDTISAVPKIDPAEFEKMFNNSLQDLLMVVYLANLTRTQVVLQEKLNSVL